MTKIESFPEPEPAAGLKVYKAIREARLASDKRCADNYAKYLHFKEHGGIVDFLPVKLDIENVSRCNFRCIMCTVSDWPHMKRANDMSLDNFKRLIDEQYGIVEIKLQGIGEPMMQGDDYFAMIRYAREHGIWVRTTTNASLLHLHDNYKKLIEAGPNEVQISVDAADIRTFQRIRRGSNFRRVISNIQLLHDNSEARRVTKMWTVVQKANVYQLTELVHLASDLGFTNQVFSLDVMNWGLFDRGLSAVPLCPEELIELGWNLGHKVWFWGMKEKYSSNHPCHWPYERSCITSDMRAAPCCVIGNPDVMELGNGIKEGFTDVWFGEDYLKFRKDHTEGNIPKACQDCYKGQN